MRSMGSVRVLLFTPGNQPERFSKACASGADGVLIDLEDGVSFAGKDAARSAVIEYFRALQPSSKFLQGLRINSLQTVEGLRDIISLVEHQIAPDLLCVPKVENPAELQLLDAYFGARPIPYVAMIETALGLHHAPAIAGASPNLVGLMFGGGDMAADLGSLFNWEAMFVARALTVQAAAMHGLAVLDVPYLHLAEPDHSGLIEEAARAKALGFSGKLAIHPKQIAPLLQVFTPSPEEVAKARRIVEAYDGSKGQACEVDGKMVDVPIYRSAKRILDIAAL